MGRRQWPDNRAGDIRRMTGLIRLALRIAAPLAFVALVLVSSAPH